MIRQTLHTHSTFDDGQNTLEEMARAAIDAGLTSLGFSVHMPMPFDACWTIPAGRLPDYFAEARRLQESYRGQIALYCGAEWDLLSEIPLDGFDFVIGSAHHIPVDGEICCVDNSPEATQAYLDELFGGDADAAAEAYFAQTAALAAVDEVDIVGHFDILTKFDETHHFCNPDSPRFQKAALGAMDALAAAGKIFELNTGAIARGYRTAPYPSRALLTALQKRGGRITFSSDAHRAQDIVFGFAEAEALARACGFTERWVFDGRTFLPVPMDDSDSR